jgi:cyanophycinase
MPNQISRLIHITLLVLFCLPVSTLAASYQYIRLGNKKDSNATPKFGIAMMGGGEDLDEAFKFLCEKASGGDLVVLRSRGDDAYNPYINGLCKLNSVSTLIIETRKAAQYPEVADIIRRAQAVFIAGGDQARYTNFWKGTAVLQAINENIAKGKPIGGTSAGLAVLGQFVYSADKDAPDDADLASQDVLGNPYATRVALVKDFIKIPILENLITDSHFAKRDRMGRTLVFLARIMQDGWSKDPREIAIDEQSAVLVEPDGKARVVGPGRGAFFLKPTDPPEVCKDKTPLTFKNISAYKAPAGSHFDLPSWTGEGGEAYSISVIDGTIHTTRPKDAVY